MADKRVKEHFSAEAEKYQKASQSGFWNVVRRYERNAIMRLLRPSPGEFMLDAGSGAGYYSEHLKAMGVEVIASDLSPQMAHQVIRRLQVPTFVADLEHMTLRPRFDAVLCAGALEFCPHPERAIACMARGLAPRGRLVAMLPRTGVAGRIYRTFHRSHQIEVQLFSPRRLSLIASRLNLRVDALAMVGMNYVVRMRKA
jgi:ubiquinone/menaquinone biosynthesis C-methylase UbiE